MSTGGRTGQLKALEAGRATSPPQTSAIKAGLYLAGTTTMPCDRCAVAGECPEHKTGERCALEQAYIPERRRQVAEAVEDCGGDAALLAPLIQALIFSEIRHARALRYLTVEGETRPEKDGRGMEYSPIARAVSGLEGSLRKNMAELGLSPVARAKLEASKPTNQNPLVRAVLEQDAEEQRRRRETIDAEFTEEADTDDP